MGLYDEGDDCDDPWYSGEEVSDDGMTDCDLCFCEMQRCKFNVCKKCCYKKCLWCQLAKKGRKMICCMCCPAYCCITCNPESFLKPLKCCDDAYICSDCSQSVDCPERCEYCGSEPVSWPARRHKRSRDAPSSSDRDVQVQKVLLRDREGQAIDFGSDPSTTEKLLRVVSGFKQYESNLVKKEVEVKTEASTDDDSIAPDDSASNGGMAGLASFQRSKQYESGRDSSISDLSCHFHTSEAPLSLVSAKSEGDKGKCFLTSALFIAPDGRFVEAGSLQNGSIVLSDNGQPLEVSAITLLPPTQQEMVELQAGINVAGSATLKVTSSHRVLVRRGLQAQTISAGALRIGDDVFRSGNEPESLVSIRKTMEKVEIAEITFSPDLPIAAFAFPPASILSKGKGFPKTTRRAMRRRHDADDLPSIPDTEDSFR